MDGPRPTAAPGVVTRNVGGETVLVPTRVGVADFRRIFLLSRVGAFLWQHLDGRNDRTALCELVRARFAVGEGHDVGADVDAFLSQLDERGLLAS